MKQTNKLFLSLTLFVTTRAIALSVAIVDSPPLVESLYLPFVEYFVSSPSIDPWSENAQAGFVTAPDAFPYGWPLLLIMALAVVVFDSLGNASLGILALYGLADIAVFKLLLQFRKRTKYSPSLVYSLSPAPPLALAFVGANDFIPMLAILVGVIGVIGKRPNTAGVAFGIAVGTKAILAFALVAAILFLYREHRDGSRMLRMAFFAVAFAGISLAPAIYSADFRVALATSQSAISTLSFGLSFQGGGALILAPLVIGLSVIVIWQLKRMNSDLLMLTVATPLYLVAALPNAPLGWYLWALPLLSILLAKLPARFLLLAIAGCILNVIGGRTGQLLQAAPVSLQQVLYDSSSSLGLLASIVLVGLLWREFFVRSDFVKLREKPALILIAGDSGTGKDTLAEGFARCLGQDSTVHLSGDDYHLWDRGNGTWKFLTHLNPEANDLSGYFQGILALVSGKSIGVRKYDHRLGRRLSLQTAKSREFVVSSGLHALWSSDINAMASLTVFLEMEEDLRLDRKVSRDVINRAQSRETILESIQSRKEDYEKYLLRQRSFADLVISSRFAASRVPPSGPVSVEFLSQPKIFDSRLMSELAHTCGLEAQYAYHENGKRSIRVTGDFSSSLLDTALQRMEPDVSEVISPENSWSDGAPGIVQFIAVLYLTDSLRRERLIR